MGKRFKVSGFPASGGIPQNAGQGFGSRRDEVLLMRPAIRAIMASEGGMMLLTALCLLGLIVAASAHADAPAETKPLGPLARESSLILDIPKSPLKRVAVKPTDLKTPPGDSKSKMWPVLATDIITQIRFSAHGRWDDWQPRNILRGGDMGDSNGDGIPDWASVMRLREYGNLIYADTRISDWPPPEDDYWHGKAVERGSFTDNVEHPPGAKQSLRLARATSDGQDTAAMRLDLVPPDTDLTVCGWTKYDLGDETSMGVMSRFHEFDTAGNRVNKYVLLGDDDFHQPSGRSEWTWRALSFRSLPETTFLNLYPIRMIAAKGRAWAGSYEIRLGSVWGRGKVVFREGFENLDGWELSGGGSVEKRSLVLSPDPLKVATATQRKPVRVKPGRMYAFRIAMENDVPESYEKTHQAWVSAYLEFYDAKMRFLDYCKVMAFRPKLGRTVGAAMIAPEGSRFARFMLVASHITYGERAGMTGPMKAYFGDLRLEESEFDPTFTPRVEELSAKVPRGAEKMEIRAFLLSRQDGLSPSFSGWDVDWE
jgi:hypothetical protein